MNFIHVYVYIYFLSLILFSYKFRRIKNKFIYIIVVLFISTSSFIGLIFCLLDKLIEGYNNKKNRKLRI